jgi:predicted GNAT family acetyltransferase
MQVDRYASVRPFLAAAGAFLAAREAEHNLMLGIAGSLDDLETDAGAPEEVPYLAVVTDGDRIAAAAMRTPPYNLILSETDEPAAIDALADDLAGEELPGVGVVGPPDAVTRIADRIAARAGGGWQVSMRERIFRLERVVPSRPVAGFMRPPSAADRALLIDWIAAFRAEALAEEDADRVAESVDDWLAGRYRTLYLWDDGEPVSLVGAGGETPHGIRIGPVYTPPRLRRRGYASALTAAVSQRQLDEGRRFCFLYTDQANPTSNKIYAAIGYEPVTDALMIRFTSPA